MIDKVVNIGSHQMRVILADGASEPMLDYGKCRTKKQKCRPNVVHAPL